MRTAHPLHPSLQSLISDYARAQRRRGLEPGTIRQRRYKVLALGDHLAPLHIFDATTEDIETWLDSLGVANRTRSTYVGHVRAFYGWARSAGHIEGDPSVELAAPKLTRRLPRPIADGDLVDALEQADARMLALLSLMAYEGLRCIEVSRLRGEDVDTRTMTLRLWGKGDKQRIVPLHPHTLEALRVYHLPASGPIFTRHNRPGPPQAITAGYVSQLVSAFLPGRWTAHQLRHWFGTHFYRACSDLLMTQEVMGHARPETTAGYALADVSRAAVIVGSLSVGR